MDEIRNVVGSPAVLWTIVLILITTFYFFTSKSAGTKKDIGGDDWSSLYEEGQNTASTKSTPSPIQVQAPQSLSSSDPELKNVFDVKQTAPKIQEVNGHSSEQKGTDDKPFKSSYYYAHNNPNTTGGYKDGLKAEDYVMNGPRLLSKSKRSGSDEVSNGPSNGSIDGPANGSTDGSTSTASKTKTKTNVAPKTKIDSTAINRYLWDDDGNSDGIARIIINTLPSSSSSTASSSASLNWQDMGLTKDDVKSKLVGVWKNGLIIQIRHKINEHDNDSTSYKRYHLNVPLMFGEVDEVKLLVKAKKLIVKLYKKKEKDNLKAWPQLPSQVTKQVPSSKDASYLEEDLFYNDDLKETD